MHVHINFNNPFQENKKGHTKMIEDFVLNDIGQTVYYVFFGV